MKWNKFADGKTNRKGLTNIPMPKQEKQTQRLAMICTRNEFKKCMAC